jgi:hypothetical protein
MVLIPDLLTNYMYLIGCGCAQQYTELHQRGRICDQGSQGRNWLLQQRGGGGGEGGCLQRWTGADALTCRWSLVCAALEVMLAETQCFALCSSRSMS